MYQFKIIQNEKSHIILAIVIVASFTTLFMSAKPLQRSLSGAWQLVNGTEEYSLLAADNYLMVTRFDKTNKKFISTFGGKPGCWAKS